MTKFIALVLLTASATFAADAVGKVFDDQVGTIEREVLGLAQKMPADKYDFVPTAGTFTGVRSFGGQVKHLSTIMFQIASSVGGEKPPVEIGVGEDGPANLTTKDQIVDYMKTALAFAHKAMNSVTEQNMLDQVPSPFGFGMSSRLAAAAFLGMHTNDHYGQMVEYARMNNVVPGNGPGPAPAKGKGKAKQ